MSSPLPLLVLFLVLTLASTTSSFTCTTSTTCTSLVGYTSPNTTTLSRIQSLFQLPTLLPLLSANHLPETTPRSHTVLANQTVTIPFPCRCINGSGVSDHVPQYTIVKDDGLYHIAHDVFAGLMTSQQIQTVNNIPNPNLIFLGNKLWIPLPCSCDDVDEEKVVHYGHVVDAGSSVEAIAAEFGVAPATVLQVNGITDPKQLIAGQVIDVPLRACSSSVGINSPDYPLLVANGTDFYTANNCVKCSCHSTNNFTLLCKPSGLKPASSSSRLSSCPSTQCSLGNSTSSTCSRSTCAYAGYTDTQILTTQAVENTCAASTTTPAGKNGASKNQEGGLFVLITIQLLMMIHRFL